MTKLLLPRGYRNAEVLNRRLQTESEAHWIKRGENRALNLFHEMAIKVPAYKDFLKANSFDPASVKSYKDFATIPPIDKDNYLRKYPKEMLCWDGEFPDGQWVISTTSGSSGKPYYFPRAHSQDWQYAVMAELYLRNNFNIHERRTLYIVAFPMGAWIGGLFTYEALKILAHNSGYDLSIITPGIHKQEVINAVEQLGSNFDQIIIGAYAPFLKDILDDGARAGIKWQELNLGFVFSAEAFTETFRDHVFETAGIDDPLRATLNHYGTVDLGTMAHETPESILIRRQLLEKHELTELFPEPRRQPTFAQYIPELFHFEEVNNNLLCSAYSGLPLVRYDLKDYGGVLTRKEAHQKLKSIGFDVEAEASKAGITDTLWNLPFVYVYERNDFSVSYYAFLIYPDTIRRCLHSKELKDSLTGKFSMMTDFDKNGQQQFHVHCELKHGVAVSPDLTKQIIEALHQRLLEESSEYREVDKTVNQDTKPVVHLHKYEDPLYFQPGAKQKWVLK